MPTGPRRPRAKGLERVAGAPGQQTLKLWRQPEQVASSITSQPSRDVPGQIGDADDSSRDDAGLEDRVGSKRKAVAMAKSGAAADEIGGSLKRRPCEDGGLASSSDDLSASTPRVMSLRERLAAKKGGGAAAPAPEVEPTKSHAGSAREAEHKELGGLSLRWRLLMTPNPSAHKEPQTDLAAKSPSNSPPTLPTVATPCRSEQAPSEASPKAAEQLQEPATPSPSERAAPHETPTPPQSQSGSSSSRRDSFDAEQRQRSPGGPTDSPASCLNGSPGSVKELKAHLKAHHIDTANCVEKRDLQVLWDSFQRLRREPLDELRRACTQRGAGRGDLADADACARYLLEMDQKGRASAKAASHEEPRSEVSRATASAPSRSAEAPTSTSNARAEEASLRNQAAKAEAHRILALKQKSFKTRAAWGFAVLATTCKTAQAVSRAFRTLMLKLHPDRAGGCTRVADALEILREAKECCERAVSMRDPPPVPRRPSARVVCSTPGRRQIKMDWSAPESREEAPVRRYILAAFDPSYGRAITVAVLEPDYSEELGRFVPVEELLSYTLHEKNLQKVPVFRQAQVKLQVAAANEAGQSPWAAVTVPLRAA